MKKAVSVCWFRRDLRLNDNTALFHALQSPYPVLPLFIFDPEILNELSDKHDKRVAFIHRRLLGLDLELRTYGSSFYVIFANVLDGFKSLLINFDIKEIFLNHDYEPYAINRDAIIKNFAEEQSILIKTFKDQVIFERSEILKSNGTPFTVFTPYSRKWRQLYEAQKPNSFPSQNFLSNLVKNSIGKIPSLEELGFEDNHTEIITLNKSERVIAAYHQTRNIPGVNGTSQVSPYLRFGIISIRALVNQALRWNETWLNELIWREFFMMILYHYPRVINESFKKKFDKIPWRNNEHEFTLWCRGETGYPIVDAGMRQLNETGWMHNRVRMIVSGFLTKHLLIDWRWGEAYFAQKLLDYELSSNNGNWQWAAGSGCDSAPYFRIFNPTAQTKKFDPDLVYIKTWIKDFNKYHLIPIVEHEFARKRALNVYQKALKED